YCWGSNSDGQLGNNSTTDSLVPVAVTTAGTPMTGKTIQAISAGYHHTCALDTAGAVYCWGYNNYGQLGNNSSTDSLVPVAVTTVGTDMSGKTIQAISVGDSHTCALDTAGAVYCWGYNGSGQLGNKQTDSKTNMIISHPTYSPKITATGKAQLLKSDGSVWREYIQTSVLEL
ncbi:MAG TPA: chromosome condensation regulator RCC1, partial [Candidatus Saccharibacteria bacterium]|nr:chromosome condensation regulator RCC1 [Candidatus Saccharibacteria bacterium]